MSIHSPTIADHKAELQLRLAIGERFEEIEDWIESLLVAEDLKAALWLLAWSEQERPVQRRVALDALVQIEQLQ